MSFLPRPAVSPPAQASCPLAGHEPLAAGCAAVPVYPARQLTRGGVLAFVDLDGQVYTLRITRANKLILTK